MSNATRWVGIDLHRRRSQIAMIDEDGELTLSKRIPTGRETITELLGDPARDACRAGGDLRLGVAGGAARGSAALTCTSRTRCGPGRSLPRG